MAAYYGPGFVLPLLAAALATRDRPASVAERAVIFRMAQALGLPDPV